MDRGHMLVLAVILLVAPVKAAPLRIGLYEASRKAYVFLVPDGSVIVGPPTLSPSDWLEYDFTGASGPLTASDGRVVGVDFGAGGKVVASHATVGDWERFLLVKTGTQDVAGAVHGINVEVIGAGGCRVAVQGGGSTLTCGDAGTVFQLHIAQDPTEPRIALLETKRGRYVSAPSVNGGVLGAKPVAAGVGEWFRYGHSAVDGQGRALKTVDGRVVGMSKEDGGLLVATFAAVNAHEKFVLVVPGTQDASPVAHGVLVEVRGTEGCRVVVLDTSASLACAPPNVTTTTSVFRVLIEDDFGVDYETVRRFAPSFQFHQYERFFPTSIERLAQGGVLKEPGKEDVANPSQTDLAQAGREAYLQIDRAQDTGMYNPTTREVEAPLYYSLLPVEPRSQILDGEVWKLYPGWLRATGQATPDHRLLTYPVFDVLFYMNHKENADLRAVYGVSVEAYYTHWLAAGLSEGRPSSEVFEAKEYRRLYPDLNAAFGDDYAKYVTHFLEFGMAEGRCASPQFCVKQYKALYADVEALSNAHAMSHYLRLGLRTGRIGKLWGKPREQERHVVGRYEEVMVYYLPLYAKQDSQTIFFDFTSGINRRHGHIFFNDYGQHGGDIERVFVRLRRERGSSTWEPASVGYAAHGDEWEYLPEAVPWAWGTHPIVYVALGGHSSWNPLEYRVGPPNGFHVEHRVYEKHLWGMASIHLLVTSLLDTAGVGPRWVPGSLVRVGALGTPTAEAQPWSLFAGRIGAPTWVGPESKVYLDRTPLNEGDAQAWNEVDLFWAIARLFTDLDDPPGGAIETGIRGMGDKGYVISWEVLPSQYKIAPYATLERFVVPAMPRWLVGDVNGDGRDDLVLVHAHPAGGVGVDVYTAANGDGLGGGFRALCYAHFPSVPAVAADHQLLIGDFTGDGKATVIHFFGKDHDPPNLYSALYSYDATSNTMVHRAQQPQASYAETQWGGTFLVGRFFHVAGKRPHQVMEVISRGGGMLTVFVMGHDDATGFRVLARTDTPRSDKGSFKIANVRGPGENDVLLQMWPTDSGKLRFTAYQCHVGGRVEQLTDEWAEANEPAVAGGAGTFVTGDFNMDGKDEILQFWSHGGNIQLTTFFFDPNRRAVRQLGKNMDLGMGDGPTANGPPEWNWMVTKMTGDGYPKVTMVYDSLLETGMQNTVVRVYDMVSDGVLRLLHKEKQLGTVKPVGWAAGNFRGSGADQLVLIQEKGFTLYEMPTVSELRLV